MRTFLTIALASILMGTAVSVFAQGEDEGAPIISFEDAMLQRAYNGEDHIGGRMARRILALQEAAAAAKFAYQLQSSSSSQAVVTIPTPDLSTLPSDGVVQTPDGDILTLSAAELRMLARMQSRGIEDTGDLHSGAPLYPSGAGTVIALLALACAVGVTYAWSWRMERKAMKIEVV